MFTNLGPVAWIGDRLFVVHRANDTTRAFLIDAKGQTSAGFVVPPGARQLKPSPDGRQIVFIHGAARHVRIAVADFDGANVRDVTGEVAGAQNPDWSRDGKHIAVTLIDSTGVGQIASIDVDDGQSRVVTHFDPAEGLPQWASWSPNGQRLVIQAGKYNPTHIEESNAHLWVVDLADGRALKLAPHVRTYLDETPAWFADGQRIAFQSNRTGILQVWTMKPDGTDARQLTTWHP